MRRKKTFTAEDGRDANKKFEITELPADQGDRWLSQVLVLIWEARGTTVPANLEGTGAAGVAASGVDLSNAKEIRAIQDPSIDPITWSCIRYVHDPKHPPQEIVDGVNSQIEEISTRNKLRIETINLHVGFFLSENPPASATQPSRLS